MGRSRSVKSRSRQWRRSLSRVKRRVSVTPSPSPPPKRREPAVKSYAPREPSPKRVEIPRSPSPKKWQHDMHGQDDRGSKGGGKGKSMGKGGGGGGWKAEVDEGWLRDRVELRKRTPLGQWEIFP